MDGLSDEQRRFLDPDAPGYCVSGDHATRDAYARDRMSWCPVHPHPEGPRPACSFCPDRARYLYEPSSFMCYWHTLLFYLALDTEWR